MVRWDYHLVMSFSEDDESKTAPEKEDKEPFGINDKDMKDLIPLVAVVAVVFLFKDEIMGLLKGGLPGPSAPAAPAPTETETEQPAEGGEDGGAETGGKKGGKRGGRGRRGRRGGRGGRKAMRDKAKAEAMGESYFGIANA